MRMSLGFHSFLNYTVLPKWFPMSNLEGGQQKVLSMLSMKKDNHGNVVWDESARPLADSYFTSRQDRIPMEPRSCYRVCVVGGGAF
jgi:hypothetical protein